MNIDPQRIQDALDQHEAELIVLRSLLVVLCQQHPDQQKLKTIFQSQIDDLCANVPPGTDPELIVEIRARTQLYLRFLSP